MNSNKKSIFQITSDFHHGIQCKYHVAARRLAEYLPTDRLVKSTEYGMERQRFCLGFTAKQVQRLYSRFKILDKRDCGFLTREDLFCIPEVILFCVSRRLLSMNSGQYKSIRRTSNRCDHGRLW